MTHHWTEYEEQYVRGQISILGTHLAYFELGQVSKAWVDRQIERGLIEETPISIAYHQSGAWEGTRSYRFTETGRQFAYDKGLVDEDGESSDKHFEDHMPGMA